MNLNPTTIKEMAEALTQNIGFLQSEFAQGKTDSPTILGIENWIVRQWLIKPELVVGAKRYIGIRRWRFIQVYKENPKVFTKNLKEA